MSIDHDKGCFSWMLSRSMSSIFWEITLYLAPYQLEMWAAYFQLLGTYRHAITHLERACRLAFHAE